MDNPTQGFFELLYSRAPEGLFVYLWRLSTKGSHWFPVGEWQAMQKLVTSWQPADTYLGVGLADHVFGTSARCPADQVAGIPGFWADVDFADSSAHKKGNLPPSVESALTLLDEMPVRPTIVIHSGHGLQAYWVLAEFWRFADADDRRRAALMLQGWQHLLRTKAAAYGWTVDATHDLARVLRVPGTINLKHTPVEVRIIDAEGPFTPVADFAPYCKLPENVAATPTRPSAGTTAGALKLDPNAAPDFELWESLCRDEPKARQTFERKRKDLKDDSPSSYDLSLATLAAKGGWTDQQITDLLIAARRSHGDDLKLREDYYVRTLLKARSGLVAQRSAEKLGWLKLVRDRDHRLSPEELREHLTATFGVPVDGVDKYTGDPPVFHLWVDGQDINLGEAVNLIAQQNLRTRLAAACGHYLPTFNRDAWAGIAQALLDLASVIDSGDETTDKGSTLGWLAGYLTEVPSGPITEQTVLYMLPFVDDNGRNFIFLDGLRGHLHKKYGDKVTKKSMGHLLRLVGAEPEHKHMVGLDGKDTCRSVWQVTPALQEAIATTIKMRKEE